MSARRKMLGPGVTWELGLVLTPAIIETARKENARYGQKIVWNYWDAGFERSYHGEPNVIDLGIIE